MELSKSINFAYNFIFYYHPNPQIYNQTKAIKLLVKITKYIYVRMKYFSYNRKFFAISAAKSSSELMTVQRAVEEALRGTRKSKHTLSPNHDKNKRSTTKSK